MPQVRIDIKIQQLYGESCRGSECGKSRLFGALVEQPIHKLAGGLGCVERDLTLVDRSPSDPVEASAGTEFDVFRHDAWGVCVGAVSDQPNDKGI